MAGTMDSERWQRISPHLDRALDMDGRERHVWLESLRTQDAALAAELAGWLADRNALERAGFLEMNAPSLFGGASLAGQTFGAYTLVAPLGHGGMGQVWMARRCDGRFEGTVAIKLLNIGLLGRAGEERFRREGSILARLQHPGIAHLIDAGVSPGGQPYLILELVDGEPIDQYADRLGLGIAARVRLFLDVLGAVAHAHANLVVHRDIKPSNVFVEKGGRVKLLDFGIAKLIQDESQPTELTALTREGAWLLTPEYAAPEQLTGQPISTATDVYALGVLLHVLLSGQHPMGGLARSPADWVHAIVTADARRLSDVVSLSEDAAAPTAAAARRGVTPDKLRRSLRGDLDTIVGKALKKRPQDRYASVLALAGDLQRYLDHQPISARPDTVAYRAVKFVGRHRRGVATAFAIVLLLVGLTGFHTVRLAAERDRARFEADKAATVSAFLSELFVGADPYATRDTREPTVRELLDIGAERARRDLAGEPALLAEMLTVIGRVHQRLGHNDRAQPLLEQALALGRSLPEPESVQLAQTLNDLGVLLRMKGDYLAATPVLEEALRLRQRLMGAEDEDVAVTLVELGRTYDDQGLPDRAEPLFREALTIRRHVLGDAHRETATSASDLGLLLRDTGDLDGAEALLREALDISREALGTDHPNVAISLNNLGLLLADRGDHAGAAALYREALALKRRVLGPNDRSVAASLNNLAHTLRERGEYGEAVAALEEALDIVEPTLGRDHPSAATFITTLGWTRLAQGDAAAAEPLLREALRTRQRVYPADDWRIGVTKSLLGESLTVLGRHEEAERLLLEARTVLRDVPGPQGRQAEATRARLVTLYDSWGRPHQAAAYGVEAPRPPASDPRTSRAPGRP